MRIVVAGAGLARRRLIAELAASRYDVIAIDLNWEFCELVSSKLGVVAICGNATDTPCLRKQRLAERDVVIALMRQSADNLAFLLLTKRAGVTSIIDVAGLFVDQLLMEIEHSQIDQLPTFASGRGIIVSLKVPQTSRAAGKTIREIAADRRFPQE